MIDHISIAVRDLARCGVFYDAVLATIGHQRLVTRPTAIGFGKKYPEFWLNERRDARDASNGAHVALRASDIAAVDAFHAAALAAGGRSDGAPGMREATLGPYYAAFIGDPEGNRIEAVTFVKPE